MTSLEKRIVYRIEIEMGCFKTHAKTCQKSLGRLLIDRLLNKNTKSN